MLTLYGVNSKLKSCLKGGIEVEVFGSGDMATLFRLNSVTTKMMTAYAFLVGKGFVERAVGGMWRR